ncbi:MAG: AI-2E family transporter [Bacteroidia bacterium]|nr:AI-2E family transporter [Bacteroidia bacterium]MCF8447019.1 AI-2E family transporter [Bacteroidia bacterium]
MKEKSVSQQTVDIALRLSLLFGLLYWCFLILSPFLMPVIWALIIAVAANPLQIFLETKFRFKPSLAATLIVVSLLSIILVPAILFFSSATQVIIQWNKQFTAGTFTMPEVPAFIEKWPLIGDKLHEFLDNFNSNVEALLIKYQSQIIDIAQRILKTILGTGLGVLEVILSIVLSGIFLAIGDRKKFSGQLMDRIIGSGGHGYVDLSVQTIRSVVKGVLGVAVIQTLLAGIGFYLAGIPNAPIWTLICLILAIVQVGPGLVIIGCLFYLFDAESTLFASLWTAYFVGVLLSDNILRPFLLGKGASVPMVVIFLGVIGGFMLSGFIGLFIGAIILSMGYKMFLFWMENDGKVLFNSEETNSHSE